MNKYKNTFLHHKKVLKKYLNILKIEIVYSKKSRLKFILSDTKELSYNFYRCISLVSTPLKV